MLDHLILQIGAFKSLALNFTTFGRSKRIEMNFSGKSNFSVLIHFLGNKEYPFPPTKAPDAYQGFQNRGKCYFSCFNTCYP